MLYLCLSSSHSVNAQGPHNVVFMEIFFVCKISIVNVCVHVYIYNIAVHYIGDQVVAYDGDIYEFGSFIQSKAYNYKENRNAAVLYVAHTYDHCIRVINRVSLTMESLTTPCNKSLYLNSFSRGLSFSDYQFLYPKGKR